MLGLLFEFLTSLSTGAPFVASQAALSVPRWDAIAEDGVQIALLTEAPPDILRAHVRPTPRSKGPPPAPAGADAVPDHAPALPLSPAYLEQIKKLEGFRRRAARDYRQYSNGYGTRARFPGEVISRHEAERRFRSAIGKAAAVVDGFAPDLPAGVRAALTSLTYNAGADWTHDGLGNAIRAGDMAGARERFLSYTRAGGAVRRGLVVRRQSEAAWFDQS
jgi:GH24 family phage-related lysozyme (muramidase)